MATKLQTSSVTIPQFATGAFHCFGLRARVDLGELIQVDAGIYASPEPPFYIDEWWKEQLGKLQVETINRCSLFLLAQTSDDGMEPFLAGHLQSYYLSLLLQGVGYSARGVILAGKNSTNGLRVNSIGTHNTYHEPYKVIAHSVTKEHLAATPGLAKGIDFIFADKSKYLRLRKGFNAFLDGIGQNEVHSRLHNFVRAIDAVIKSKQGAATKNFKSRCQFFIGGEPKDVSLLGELYELRSAAEHLNPMNDKLVDYPSHDRDNVKGLRTLQSELLASFIYRKILSCPELLKHFSCDDSIDALWSKDHQDLVTIWSGTIDVHSARGSVYDRPPDGKFLDYLD
jgi:hypothetical protein